LRSHFATICIDTVEKSVRDEIKAAELDRDIVDGARLGLNYTTTVLIFKV